MNIRANITLTFFILVIIVLTAISFSIYYLSANYRATDFYRRLKNRAINTAQILTAVKEVDAELLRRMERNNPASLPNQYIAIYNEKNEELYNSEGREILQPESSLFANIRKSNEIKLTIENYEAIGFVFSDEGANFLIIAAASDEYGLDALANLRNVLLITFSISAIFVSILGWIYAGKVLSPISRIVSEVSNITEANLNERLDEGNKKDELSKLAHTFNRMLSRLQSAFTSQKNFIANASHEIKTPLTVLSGEIEVTLLHDREKEYYIRILRSVLAGLKSLNKLSTQLLLLAQTSADQPEKNFKLLRVDDILWSIKEELFKSHPENTINIIFDLSVNHESLSIEGDEQLLRVAILNLIDNGCKYSDDRSVTIMLGSRNTQFITIEFINKGPGIDEESIHKIFEPFYRGKNNKRIKGFGIGLSLVNRIINLHNGRITVHSIPSIETRFTVTLPVRK